MILEKQETTYFEKIKFFFDYLNLNYTYEPISKENKIEQILVKMNDINNSESVVQMFFTNDLVKQIINKDLPEIDRFYNLQFVSFIEKENIEKQKEIIYLVNYFNSLIQFGTFVYEIDKGIYFKYNLYSDNKMINASMLIEILNNIQDILDTYGTELLFVIKENKSIEDAINSISQKIQEKIS